MKQACGCLHYIQSCELWHEKILCISYTVIFWCNSLFYHQTPAIPSTRGAAVVIFYYLVFLSSQNALLRCLMQYKPGGHGGLHLLFSDIGWQPPTCTTKTPLKPPKHRGLWIACQWNIHYIHHFLWQLWWRCCSRMSQNDFTAENSQKKSIKLGRRLSQKPLSQKRYILWGLLILWLPDITRKMTVIHMSEYSCIIGDLWSPTSLRGNHSKEKCKVKAREVHSLSKTSLKCVFISVLFSRI